jgi:hypothetical protein
MKKQLLFGIALLCSAFLSNVMAANPSVDPATYANRALGVNNLLTFKSSWLYSNKLNNYNVAADLIGAANYVRGMAVQNGKMLFIDRNLKQITVVNGTTGLKESPVVLASNIFTYMGRNKANTADSAYVAGTLPFNDIKVDNAGNVLLGNCITSNAGRFQIWKINLTTGAGTLVIDQANLATLFPLASTMRFDAFGVWGDVNTNAVIMAANASTTAMEAYKWVITNGVAGTPTVIDLDATTAGTYLTGLANLGSAPQIFPLDDNLFYIDGNATYPTLMDKDGNVIDGFYAKPSALKDSVTAPPAKWTMNQGHNGLAEFQVGDNYFFIMAATNTAGAPTSTFRLFKFADSSKAFSGLDCLWTFPQAGMGGASNAYRTAMPCVEVSGNKASIYVYTGENGYGKYEMEVIVSGISKINKSAVTISLKGNQICFSEEVAVAEVYSIAGQKISSLKNISTLNAPVAQGIYIVSLVDQTGAKKIQKVAIN